MAGALELVALDIIEAGAHGAVGHGEGNLQSIAANTSIGASVPKGFMKASGIQS